MLRRSFSSLKLSPRQFHSSSTLLKIQPFVLSDIGEGIQEVEIIQWFVKPGDSVKQFDKIVEVQSDKAAVEISSRYDGIIGKLYGSVGDVVEVGGTLVDIDTGNDGSENVEPVVKDKVETSSVEQQPNPISQSDRDGSKMATLATPAVRRLAREHDLDLSSVKASGKDGRVLKQDVLDYVSGKSAPSVNQNTQSETKVQLNSIQKAMFKQMTKSLSIPHFGYTDKIDLTQSTALRRSINEFLAKQASPPVAKITQLSINIKALSLALIDFPILNARVENGEVFHRFAHNVGVAIDSPQGLVVANVKNVQSKSIIDVAVELALLKQLADTGKLGVQELQGTTITLSNIGNIGGTVLNPVIVDGTVAIGAIGRSALTPVVKDGDIVVREIVDVSWSADHRVVDGATMARFFNVWKGYLENVGWMQARV